MGHGRETLLIAHSAGQERIPENLEWDKGKKRNGNLQQVKERRWWRDPGVVNSWHYFISPLRYAYMKPKGSIVFPWSFTTLSNFSCILIHKTLCLVQAINTDDLFQAPAIVHLAAKRLTFVYCEEDQEWSYSAKHNGAVARYYYQKDEAMRKFCSNIP